MNFVKCAASTHSRRALLIASVYPVLPLLFGVVGCSDNIKLPTTEQVVQFQDIKPTSPTVDMRGLAKAKLASGPYRVCPEEVIELTMPAILNAVTLEDPDVVDEDAPFICRISEFGTITLPVVGEITVQGKSLGEIESAVIQAHYPRYAQQRPSVFARILEHKTLSICLDDLDDPNLALALAGDDTARLTRVASLLSLLGQDQTQLHNALARARSQIEHNGQQLDAPPGVLAALARLYAKENNTILAIKHYRKALTLDYGQIHWRYSLAKIVRGPRPAQRCHT